MVRPWLVLAVVCVIQGAKWSAAEEILDSGDIQYLLYTRAHPTSSQLLLLNNSLVEGTDFNVTKATVLLIHGYMGSGVTPTVSVIRDAFLSSADVNVVSVSWRPAPDEADYVRWSEAAIKTAQHVAVTLDSLVFDAGLSLEAVHAVGYSLGAQVVGLVGGMLKAGPLGRITALDPARPLFETRPPYERLDASDAAFVQVLHTSGEPLSFAVPIGHADFYPNGGGSPQPACEHHDIHAACSHLLAPEYFQEAIRSPSRFLAIRCDSWHHFMEGACSGGEEITFGPDTPTWARGQYYFHTAAEAPYGRGLQGLQDLQDVSSNGLDSQWRSDAVTTSRTPAVFTVIVCWLMAHTL